VLVPVSDVMSVCFPGAVARCCPGCPGMHRLRLRRAVPSAWCWPGVVICVGRGDLLHPRRPPGALAGRQQPGAHVRLRLRHVDARHPLIAQLVVLILD
jgi:hypothetical protein